MAESAHFRARSAGALYLALRRIMPNVKWDHHQSDQLLISCSVGTYISRFLNRFEIARRSAWADTVSSNTDINQLRNSDNTDTCIKHNAKIFIKAGSIFYEKKRPLKVKGHWKYVVYETVRSWICCQKDQVFPGWIGCIPGILGFLKPANQT